MTPSSIILEMLPNKKAVNYSTVYYLSSSKYWTKDFLVSSHECLEHGFNCICNYLAATGQTGKLLENWRKHSGTEKWLYTISSLVECEIKL